MASRRIFAVGLLGAVTALLLAACGGSGSSSQNSASSISSASGTAKYTITIDQPVYTLAGAPLYVAIQQGYFAKQGITVKFSTLSTASEVQEALTSGSIQFTTGGAFSIVLADAQGAGYQVVESFGAAGFQLCASTTFAAQRGISPSTPLKEMLTKLKGATLGVNGFGSPVVIPLYYLLKSTAGLDPKSTVTVVNLGSVAAAQTALERGSIDLLVNSPPVCAETSGKGEVLLSTSSMDPFKSIPYQVFYGSGSWISSHAAESAAVARAMAEGNNYVKQNPAAAAAILHNAYFPSVSTASIESVLAGYIAPNLTANGRMTLQGWQQVNDIMKVSGTVTSVPTPAEGTMWTNAYLPS
jgi:ABC-type nitrate/sulfonate/bicarbonate transport system substrate-binding protein